MIKTEEEYKAAIKRKNDLTIEIEKLDKDIIKYENKKFPSFEKIGDLHDFIMYNAKEGSKVEYMGRSYIVGDYEGLRTEYGADAIDEGMGSAKIGDLIMGGRYSLLEPIK